MIISFISDLTHQELCTCGLRHPFRTRSALKLAQLAAGGCPACWRPAPRQEDALWNQSYFHWNRLLPPACAPERAADCWRRSAPAFQGASPSPKTHQQLSHGHSQPSRTKPGLSDCPARPRAREAPSSTNHDKRPFPQIISNLEKAPDVQVLLEALTSLYRQLQPNSHGA